MTKLDWEKSDRAKKKQRRRKSGAQRLYGKYGPRGKAIADFASKHDIGCFVCTDRKPDGWAKSGWSDHGPWGLCLPCVQARKLKSDQ